MARDNVGNKKMRSGTITYPDTRTRTRAQKKQYKTFEFKPDCTHFFKFMVQTHIPLYSEKVATNEMPVEAVHTLSLFKLN